ncbi:MAG: pyrroline-5-carboxylate reductase family protein, partial [Dictyoglomus sp.]
MKLGIIGGGMMGEAILAGILESSFLRKDQILVSEVVEERKIYLKNKYNIEIISDNAFLTQNCNYILLAVKPQNIKEVLNEIEPYLDENKILISIAAGVKISFIRKYAPKVKCLIRIMPNLPCTIKKGVIALTYDKYEEKEINFVKTLFSTIGEVWVIDEKYFDTITALTGSGPAFVSLI